MDNPWVHAITSWIGGLLGTASVPAIAAAIAWKYRTQLFAFIEKQAAARLDAIVQNTALGQQIKNINEKINKIDQSLN